MALQTGERVLNLLLCGGFSGRLLGNLRLRGCGLRFFCICGSLLALRSGEILLCGGSCFERL